MSFLFGRQPQISSEQKIAQAEAEIDMVSDMYSRCVVPFDALWTPLSEMIS
jgi:import inner membrane translocase subunit TIM10